MSSDQVLSSSRSREVTLICIKTLRSLLSSTEGKAVEAVYLWGSIVRPDFVPDRSDIDSIVLGEGPDLEELCRWLSQTAAEREPTLRRFKARPLYLEDLSGGPIRSELARLIHPKILIADFENWRFVVGRQCAREEFGLTPGSLDEIFALRLEALQRRLRIHSSDPGREPAKYILKEVGFICHALHQLRLGPHPFSYSALIENADERTREAVEAISVLRESGWEEGACHRALGLAERFLAPIG